MMCKCKKMKGSGNVGPSLELSKRSLEKSSVLYCPCILYLFVKGLIIARQAEFFIFVFDNADVSVRIKSKTTLGFQTEFKAEHIYTGKIRAAKPK